MFRLGYLWALEATSRKAIIDVFVIPQLQGFVSHSYPVLESTIRVVKSTYMGSNRVGSVFLGDFQRHRHLSSSTHSTTPPSSPPSTTALFHFSHSPPPSLATASEELDIDMDTNPGNSAVQNGRQGNEVNQGPGKVDPLLALELRLRWLEVLIVGMKQEMGKDKKGKAREEYAGINAAAAAANLKHGETLTRIVETVQTKLDKFVEGNEGLKRFMDNCMCSLPLHLRYLTLALSYEQMTRIHTS